MSDPIVKCDACGTPGRRRPGHPCPDHWQYLETTDALDGALTITWACSDKCRAKLWQRGPGPNILEEDRGDLYRQRRGRVVKLTTQEREDLCDVRTEIGRILDEMLQSGSSETDVAGTARVRRQVALLDILIATTKARAAS